MRGLPKPGAAATNSSSAVRAGLSAGHLELELVLRQAAVAIEGTGGHDAHEPHGLDTGLRLGRGEGEVDARVLAPALPGDHVLAVVPQTVADGACEGARLPPEAACGGALRREDGSQQARGLVPAGRGRQLPGCQLVVGAQQRDGQLFHDQPGRPGVELDVFPQLLAARHTFQVERKEIGGPRRESRTSYGAFSSLATSTLCGFLASRSLISIQCGSCIGPQKLRAVDTGVGVLDPDVHPGHPGEPGVEPPLGGAPHEAGEQSRVPWPPRPRRCPARPWG